MARLGRLVATVLLVAWPAVAGAADDEHDEQKPAPAPAEKERGPAEDLIVEAAIGYGVGPFTAIANHKPLVAHGPTFHLALGWAWTIRYNQSVGLEAYADGMFDGARTTGSTGAVGGRYGAGAFVVGERAHVRVGGGWASNTFEGGNYQGLSVSFAAGWHVFLMPEMKTWKRPAVNFEFATSWDFLGAGDETLHRWIAGLQLGFAMY